jgi:DNA-directed RNA polymerase subunit alpha
MSHDLNKYPYMQPTFVFEEDKMAVNHSLFTVSPLENGYGHTVGNALRRVLLSSLPGAAITAVRVEGVDHQFSTLKGVKEDMVELLLNLKQIRVKADNDEKGIARLEVKGPATVTAKDFECEAGFEIVNPDQHIATLAKNVTLTMEVTVESGIGYRVGEQPEDKAIGEMMVDAIFSPVLTVSYKVENTRVGRRTDFDKLLLDVKSDGTLTPEEAVKQAAQILAKQFEQVFDPMIVEEVVDEQKLTPEEAETLRLTVEELDLPTRIANALRRGGYENVGDLLEANKVEITKVKNIGEKSITIIDEALAKKGVALNN